MVIRGFDLQKISNGWTLDVNYKTETDDPKDKWDYETDEYAFATFDEAMAKIQEVITTQQG